MKANRISATAALLLSTLTVGLSCWAIACGSTGTPAPAPAAAPSACAPAAPSVAELRTASPEAGAAPVVVAAPAAEPKARPVLPNAQISVKRLVLSRSVKGREPGVALAQVAAGEDQLYAFVEVDNRSSDDGAIVITFEKQGTRTGNIELKVPANQNRWRTWGWTRGVREPGQWSVVVRSLGGRELARTSFEAV